MGDMRHDVICRALARKLRAQSYWLSDPSNEGTAATAGAMRALDAVAEVLDEMAGMSASDVDAYLASKEVGGL
jgi:DNA-binding transcriptional regulator LsrR (DeoR family)